MARRDKSKGWVWLYIFSGGMDFIQFVIIEWILVWFFGIGIGINEVLDPIVGIIIAAWIQFGKKVSLISRPNRLMSLVGTEAVAAFTGGIAQLWVLDVWYIHSDVRKEEAGAKAAEDQQAFMQQNVEQPLYQGGRRNPRPEDASESSGPMVMDGIRAPGGGL